MTLDNAERVRAVAEAVQVVRERIDRARATAGRTDAVHLVAVTKGVVPSDIHAALEAGVDACGENRVQQALGKIDAIPGIPWHFLGRLQTNKAKAAVGRFALIHSVDRSALALALNRQAESLGLRRDILVQVDLAGRPGQGGVDPRDGPALLEAILPLPGLRVAGLMTIAPPGDGNQARRHFSRLRELRRRWAEGVGTELPELSMGMSADFEAAVLEGATMVRVGRAIFGDG